MEVFMSELIRKTLILGMVQTNCYIISNGDTKEAIVFDPADNADKIEQYLKSNDLVCKAILLTHGHFDHIMAATELAEITHTSIYAHEAEVGLLTDAKVNASAHIHKECSLIPDVLLKDEEVLQLAGFTIKVIHTPGHTAGGACYYFLGHGVLISGDTLFRGSIGRSDLPTGNGRQLVESILNKLMILEDQVAVYPGHGNATTIGYERDNNIYLTRNWDAFDM
jgi:glyoxylase-like metal-dependent hydrolase (beta-lactamase superfamily II)